MSTTAASRSVCRSRASISLHDMADDIQLPSRPSLQRYPAPAGRPPASLAAANRTGSTGRSRPRPPSVCATRVHRRVYRPLAQVQPSADTAVPRRARQGASFRPARSRPSFLLAEIGTTVESQSPLSSLCRVDVLAPLARISSIMLSAMHHWQYLAPSAARSGTGCAPCCVASTILMIAVGLYPSIRKSRVTTSSEE